MNIICILHYDRTSNQTNLSLINPDGTVIIPDIYQYLGGDFDYISVEYESGWEEGDVPDDFI